VLRAFDAGMKTVLGHRSSGVVSADDADFAD
jgi:hypothetical protein